MASNDTAVLRVALAGKRSTYRDIEIESAKLLYRLALEINKTFGFDFDHAFGFYTGLTQASMLREYPMYELFADMGEADAGVSSVKKTSIAQAFPAIRHTLLFLFDYGDEWLFRVTLRNPDKRRPAFDIRESWQAAAMLPNNTRTLTATKRARGLESMC